MNNKPVAHFYPEGEGCTVYDIQFAWKVTGTTEPIPLYTHPAKTLTDEEILRIADSIVINDRTLGNFSIDFARAILKKASEK
jgi:hypothetical protein